MSTPTSSPWDAPSKAGERWNDVLMERETDKHNPRIDDAMARDLDSLLKGAPVESRSQESRLQEDPSVGPGRRFEAEPAGPGLSS